MAYPTAKFPLSTASAADLLEQKNALPSANTPTLASSIGSGDTSFSVGTGMGALYPSANFALSVDDEIMFVGSRSGDALSSVIRGAEGTTASAHSAGARARAVYTALSHNQVASEVIALESFVQWMPPMYAPPAGDWVDGIGSGGNGGNTHITITNKPDRLILETPVDDTWHMVYNTGMPVPSPPYTVECGLLVQGFSTLAIAAGVGITDSGATKFAMTDMNVLVSACRIRVYNLTFGHTAAALTDTASAAWQSGMSFHRITDDGVNRKFWQSANGKDYAMLQSRTTGDFVTPAYGGIWVSANAAINSSLCVISVFHYRVVPSILPQFMDSTTQARTLTDSQAANWGDALTKTLA